MKRAPLKLALLALTALLTLGFTATVANACAMRARKLWPAAAKSVVADADAATKRGDARVAIRLYERVMNNARDAKLRSNAALSAARLHAAAGNTDRAVSRLRRAVNLNAKNKEAAAELKKALAKNAPTKPVLVAMPQAIAAKI